MNRCGLDMHKVKAVFVSHEHSDHIKGVERLALKYQLPVYISTATWRHSGIRSLPETLIRHFGPHQEVAVGDISVLPFPKHHDAVDPYSFLIRTHGTTVGVITDIGNVCTEVYNAFGQCNAVFLEANYDELMLEQGRYPYMLKKRIRGGKGHLSNTEALKLFQTAAKPHLTHLFLAHLSRDNNDPELVLRLFESCATATKIVVASRDRETAVYQIAATKVTIARPASPVQLQLF